MKIHRPLWNEGALLAPQQFQQQFEWEALCRANIAARGSAFPWGVAHVELDEAMLASGRVQAQSLHLWLPDDTLIDTRHSDLPPAPREVEVFASSGNAAVTVYVALPVMQAGSINVQTDAQPTERPLRYIEAWESIVDRFGQDEEPMAVARFNLAFRFDHEDNSAWDTCAIARLLQDGQGRWRHDPDFIPPIALFSASRKLCDRLALLNRQLRSRRQRLMSMRRESNDRMADFAVADVSLFWLLNALNSHARVLSEFERFPNRHPEQVWAELARLAGSMLTFSLEHDLEAIPGYDHRTPENTFPPLFDLISELLEASLPSRVVAVRMDRLDPETWKAVLHDIRLRDEADFYLSVRASQSAWQIAERFAEMCIAGAPANVGEVSGVAVEGIGLITLSRVPAALPVRLGNQYFVLDMESDAAREMLDQGVCVFYVPSLLGELELELFAVLRS
ncbi:type VI secretion system baseplate subunit TssK [Rosenbergiella australiborealis]|uniref:Type VI secretion system baseplate subunit TssK n=1 Tax=Rosenbergiella australiborealis TaxID=1544696 RepID=A0ABS5T2W0_9GAMM|nr:type VI secretion system baseplate subunit TssK [Rosenbergiella australiborealis]MBT0726697.1 type VI secretion system baseplate subunit TssK [Rosenbergiella australiborealis]